MATHKSSEKRARQSVTRNLRNRARRSEIHGKIKSVEEAVTANDATAAQKAQREAESALARGGKRGTMHWRTAARKTSRLAKRVKALGAAGSETVAKPAAPVKAKAAAKTTKPKAAAKKASA